MFYDYIECHFGRVLLGLNDQAQIMGLWFEGQKYYPKLGREDIVIPAEGVMRNLVDQVKDWLEAYLAGLNPPMTFDLNPRGTLFQEEVWKALQAVAYGQWTSYGLLAEKIAASRGLESMSAQAVGGAVGRNPISLLIPCHRVLGGQGQLTGYAGGLDKKRCFLDIEQIEYRKK